MHMDDGDDFEASFPAINHALHLMRKRLGLSLDELARPEENQSNSDPLITATVPDLDTSCMSGNGKKVLVFDSAKGNVKVNYGAIKCIITVRNKSS